MARTRLPPKDTRSSGSRFPRRPRRRKGSRPSHTKLEPRKAGSLPPRGDMCRWEPSGLFSSRIVQALARCADIKRTYVPPAQVGEVKLCAHIGVKGDVRGPVQNLGSPVFYHRRNVPPWIDLEYHIGGVATDEEVTKF